MIRDFRRVDALTWKFDQEIRSVRPVSPMSIVNESSNADCIRDSASFQEQQHFFPEVRGLVKWVFVISAVMVAGTLLVFSFGLRG